jgi:hypothetical protein
MSPYIPRGKTRAWPISEEERDLLIEATPDLRPLRAVIARATPHDEIADLLIVHGTTAEFDELYTLVEELTDVRPRRKQREILEDLRRSLCTAIDGF